ncbi:nitrite reductase small subunit NirD [Formosa sp. S-31]|uniref:nitrite reductase small subunit NirD n=1 Tax=Formosa sp. S-31 TaxID=2790949 RepID=UPI003EBB9F8A
MNTILERYASVSTSTAVNVWFRAAEVSKFPANGGVCVKYKDKQIAVYYFKRRNAWYACQNVCPHKLEMVLSRGMIGDEKGTPKVACPLHKKTFSLETGENLNGDLNAITIYPVKVEDNFVYIGFSE